MTIRSCRRVLFAACVAGTPVLAQTPAQAPVTFSEHVAPIVWKHCASCHRPGEVAPFPLLSFQDTRKKAKMIKQVVNDRYMPPWHPEPGYGEFANSMRLSDEQVRTITAWIDGGMAEGPKDKLPALPQFPTGWQLGEPDLAIKMPKGFPVPASGPDIYRNFVIPLDLPADRWLKAIEVRPSARAVLHHVLFFLDDTGEGRRLDGQDGKPGFGGMRLRNLNPIGGWAVGGIPEKLPGDLAIALPKGHDLIVQAHFHPSGKKDVEQMTIGLFLTDQTPEREIVSIQLPPLFGFAAGIDIPAGAKDWKLNDEFTLPCDVEAVTVGGHAHMLCRTMRMFAELPLPDGAKEAPKEPLLLIREWDFDWQNRYTYRAPVVLPKGSVIRVELAYDNSKDNPNNPNNPPERVRWGRESTDEMGSITLMVVPKDKADLQTLKDAVRQRTIAAAFARAGSQFEERLREFDKNRDGKVERDEVPARMRRWFEMLDRNGDGVLEGDELNPLGGDGGDKGKGGDGGKGDGGKGGK